MHSQLFSLFLFFFIFISNSSFAQSERGCSVYGSVYVVEDPRLAKLLVYEEESETFSDLIVFKEDSRVYADEVGKWYFVTNRNFADYTIAFTKNRNEANFSVFFTDEPSYAGCNN